LQPNPFHASLRRGRNPSNVFWDERALATHIAHHRARFTVSIQTVARSTVGAAGLSFDNPRVTVATIATANTLNPMRRHRLRRLWSGLAISIGTTP
jgi:hypothetical protein